MHKILILTFYIISISESKNILGVFPTPSISHQIVFRPLMLELARRGHEVTVITPDPIFPKGKTPENFTEIDVHNISYDIWNEFVEAEKGKADGLVEQMNFIFNIIRMIFEAQVNSSEVQKLIKGKEKKFDLIFSEHCVRLALSFSYLYDAPVIEFSSLGGLIGAFESLGAPSNPFIYPTVFQQKIYQATWREKLSEIYTYYSFHKFYSELEILENESLKKLFGPKTPTLAQLKEKVGMLFLNVHPIWDLNRPVPPNVLYLGGLHQNQPKQLPQDLISYLDSSQHGVIYVSFGTNVKPSLLPSGKLNILKKVFSELQYDVLWKWDSDNFLDCPKNIKIAKWFPQSDLLSVFPTPSISHQIVFRPLMLELARRGHEVTVITPDPIFPKGKTPENFTEIDVHNISYDIWNEFVEAEKGKADCLVEQMNFIYNLLRIIFEAQVNSSEVQKLIKNKEKKFDLIFSEHCARLGLSFSYLYDAPVIEFSSLGGLIGAFESVGAPSSPLIYPNVFQQKFYQATMREKISEIYTYYSFQKMYSELEILENKSLQKLFGPKTPTLAELKKKVDMLFLYTYPIWDLNRPVPPNVLYVGGLHQNPPKELPQNLISYLDSSQHGVIYVSFGTNVKPSLLPAEKLMILKKVFSELQYDVLWKWDSDNFLDCPKNVKIAKWFPQSDLLKHKKIKLFITQGGLQSTDEALAAGVPLIGIPMLADQWFNAEQYIKHKIGMKLDLQTFTEEELKNAIYTIMNNSSYRDNVIKLHKIIVDQPLSSLERAVWWTEYVLRHKGASHLKANGAHMHWTEYYEIKLVLLLLILLMGFIVLPGFVLYYVAKKNTWYNSKVKKSHVKSH